MTDHNGSGSASPDADLLKAIEKRRVHHQARVDELQAELAVEKDELTKYRRAAVALRGELPKDPDAPAPAKRMRHPTADPRRGVSAERIDMIKQLILKATEDKEEFSQVEIRTMPGADETIVKSSTMALAFEVLRQDGFIRFARQQGNKKLFRLTRSAVADVNR